MWSEILDKWFSELLAKLLLWIMLSMLAVAGITGSIVYLCMK